MAFYDAPNPTNDPNYLHQSREPSRMPTIQDVAVPAKVSSDASLGKLFSGIGEVFGLGLQATDQVIKDNIKKDAYAAIDPIRDAAGADMAPEEVQPIAGTGQRSRNRVAALGTGGAASNDGIVGNEPQNVLPAPVNLEIGRIQRLRDAYMAGKLSDSYYDAELVAKTKELKAKYPGYRDEVEAAVAGITGVNPANALRKSLLADLNAQQAAQMAKTQGFENWAMKNGGVIALHYPDFFSNRAKYAGREGEIQSTVYGFDARDKEIKAQEAEAGNDARMATQAAVGRAGLIASQSISAVSNTAGLNNPQTLMASLNKLRANGGDPEQIAEITRNFETMKAQASQNIDLYFNTPYQGRNDGMTPAMAINDPAKVKSIKEQAIAQYDAIGDALKNKAFDKAATLINMVSMQKNQAAMAVMNKVPAVKILAGIQTAGGDAAVGPVLEKTQLLPQITRGLSDTGIAEIIGSTDPSKPPPSISQQLDEQRKVVPMNGPAVKANIDARLEMIKSRALPEGVSAAAVRNLFDQNFFARLNDKDRRTVFTMLASPENTSRISELAEKDPSLWQQYKNWSVTAAQSLYSKAANDLQGAIVDKRYNITYNENTHQFEGSLTPQFRASEARSGTVQRAEAALQSMLNPVNQVFGTLAPILSAGKGDTNAELFKFMKTVNLDPTASKEDGSLTKIFQSGWSKAGEFLGKLGPGDDMTGVPAHLRPQKRSDISLEGASEPGLREVIGKAESGGDYNNVFGMGKSQRRDLSQLTVGEVMSLQKHHTDNGSPSSAAGKYQFLRKTLASLVREGVVSADDLFTPDLQDNLAVALMKRRGLDDYRAGRISKEAFVNSLAKEWAGLPTTSGMSFYEGDGLNKSTVRLPAVLAALE